ncbi:hypothetical protein Cgig2_013920 [Carnegiea gigantea]|uniref:Uncharacterized protein n=1 Tax=Carnegiea gigantea TaxID=171969 RepID=A0A9Q1GUP4_9CARY|nr:hypothetical protein Cgig2_013920 [Carnegiea gigantea]
MAQYPQNSSTSQCCEAIRPEVGGVVLMVTAEVDGATWLFPSLGPSVSSAYLSSLCFCAARVVRSTGSQEVSRHDIPYDHYSNQDSLVGNGSHIGSRHDAPPDQYRSSDSLKSGDVLSISNLLENQPQRSARSSKQIISMHDGQQKQLGKTMSLSKPSNVNNIFRSLTHGCESHNPSQPRSMLLDGGAVRPSAQPSKHTACNHDGGQSHVELTRKEGPTPRGNSIEGSTPSRHSQVESQNENPKASNEHGTAKQQEQNVNILVNTVLKNHPKEVRQYRSLEKKELIIFYLAGVAMGICKCRAEPNMLDSMLCETLDKIALVSLLSLP